MRISSNRFRLLGFSLLALALAGCDPSQPLTAPQPEATAPELPAPPPQAQAPAVPPPLTPRQQHVRQLIQQVEEAYAQGQAAYRKGMLPEAKTQFDRAVDL